MLKFDDLKNFDVAALGRDLSSNLSGARELLLTDVELDPDNIRKHCDPVSITALAQTIERDGLLQAIVVREHSGRPGRYIVSFGERRFRAVWQLGRRTITAVINNDFDPYKQAIENIQREDVHPLDLADWVAKREAVGETRVEIAHRLGKPKSYISELAQVVNAPAEIREAFRTRKITDLRTAYLLSRHMPKHGQQIREALSGDDVVTRESVAGILAGRRDSESDAGTQHSSITPAPPPRPASTPTPALSVIVDGKVGLMRLRPGKSIKHGVVCFEDGSEKAISLEKLKLTGWAVL